MKKKKKKEEKKKTIELRHTRHRFKQAERAAASSYFKRGVERGEGRSLSMLFTR